MNKRNISTAALLKELAELRHRVAELESAEAQRRQTEEMLRAFVETTNEWIWAIDLNVRHTYCNPALETILGYSPQEFVGSYNLQYLHDDDRLKVAEILKDNNARKEGWSGLVLRWRHKNGSYRHLESSAVPILDEQGRFSGFQGADRDISERIRAEEERRKLEAQIQQAQKLESLGILAGGIAHDFNNLLTAILGHANLAMLEMPSESAARGSLEAIEDASRRAAELCRQMLAYAGMGRFIVEPVNLSRLVQELTHLLQVSVSQKAILRCHFANNLPPINADPTQMRQVIMNLVINASEAIGDKEGTIAISTGTMMCNANYLRESHLAETPLPGTYVYVEVSDSGCGMDAKTRAKIFDPFFTSKFTGRGLGLAAVLGIVRSHKGVIKVESEPGKGTSFRVLFPEWPEGGGGDKSLARQRHHSSGG